MKLSKTKIKLNATYIGNNFMQYNKSLTDINLPKVTFIGYSCMAYNNGVVNINVPEVKN